MTINSDDLARIDAKIRSLAKAFLESGRPYLLSQLGKDLGEDLKLIRLSEMSLGEYIAERLSNEYSIILMGQHRNIQAIVSRDGNPIEVEGKTSPPRGPRYNYRFWASFSVPLEGEGPRWFNLDDFTFKDVPKKPDDNYVQIPSDLIAPAVADNRDELIKTNISKWLEKEGLSPERFFARNKITERDGSGPMGQTLLEAIIQTLDRKQLSSTTLSLDVVADLLRRRV